MRTSVKMYGNQSVNENLFFEYSIFSYVRVARWVYESFLQDTRLIVRNVGLRFSRYIYSTDANEIIHDTVEIEENANNTRVEAKS